MRAVWITCSAFIANVLIAAAQPFLITTTPQSVTITDATATFKVASSVQSGFKASIYLSAECPTLPHAGISISPSVLNAPYSDSATVTVTLTGPKTGGTHNLFITARNGSAQVRDTVELSIPNRSAWTVFTRDQLDQYWGLDDQHFIIDRQNGVGWFGAGDSLMSYDGVVWNEYAWPDTTPTQPYYSSHSGVKGMCIDSTGLLYVLRGGALLQWGGGTWTIIGQVDSSVGLTPVIFESMQATLSHAQLHAGLNDGVWISGWGREGMELIQYNSTHWTQYTRSNSELGFGDSRFISDALGNVWIQGYHNGLTKFDGTYWTFYPSEFFGLTSQHEVFPLSATPDGSLWLRNGYTISRFHSDSTHATPYNELYATFGRQTISAIDIAPDGDMWVGLQPYYSEVERYPGGIARFDGSTWWHYTIDNSGLPDNFVTDLKVDNNNNVWIITGEGSLTVLNGNVPPNEVFIGTVSSVNAPAFEASAASVEIAPNPITDRGLIRLHLAAAEHVEIVLVNSLGRRVETIADGVHQAGDQLIPFGVESLAPGSYFLQINVGSRVQSLPVAIMR